MKRWVGVAALVWAIVVGVGAYVAARHGLPTAREQTTVADARASVDDALVRVAIAAGPDAVAALSAYTVRPGCRITTARKGTDLARTVRLYTAAGGERALLDRLAAALPGSFDARVPRPIGSASPRLRADAADFVSLRGDMAGPGELRVEAEAGCRTGTLKTTVDPPSAAERASLEPVLRALNAAPAKWHSYQAPCVDGGTLRTIEADSVTSAPPKPLPAALQAVSGSTPAILSQPQRYAFRTGSTAVAVRLQDTAVTVTSTTGCL